MKMKDQLSSLWGRGESTSSSTSAPGSAITIFRDILVKEWSEGSQRTGHRFRTNELIHCKLAKLMGPCGTAMDCWCVLSGSSPRASLRLPSPRVVWAFGGRALVGVGCATCGLPCPLRPVAVARLRLPHYGMKDVRPERVALELPRGLPWKDPGSTSRGLWWITAGLWGSSPMQLSSGSRWHVAISVLEDTSTYGVEAAAVGTTNRCAEGHCSFGRHLLTWTFCWSWSRAPSPFSLLFLLFCRTGIPKHLHGCIGIVRCDSPDTQIKEHRYKTTLLNLSSWTHTVNGYIGRSRG